MGRCPSQLGYTGATNPAYGDVLAIRLGLLGVNAHMVATTLAGAGLGAWLAADRRSRVPLALGIAAAIGVHGTWNLVGSDLATTFVLALTPGADFAAAQPFPQWAIFAASSGAQALVLAAPIGVLAITWRRARRPGSIEGSIPDPAAPAASAPAVAPPTSEGG